MKNTKMRHNDCLRLLFKQKAHFKKLPKDDHITKLDYFYRTVLGKSKKVNKLWTDI